MLPLHHLRCLIPRKIETLPTRSAEVQPLQNVLSISTAGKNRYLFHFNSLHSLTQWTAAIRLAMFENASLQEAYTGSLIAGKGKLLNNIKVILERTRIKNEDWTRVRFGAGTPWRRCWCVITPPDEKDVQKQQRQVKKKSVYERVQPLKGNVKFYDTKKTKKATPIATINDAYSAYAIYPQSKPLIDQSTLIKVEGSITIHSTPDITTEGFIFVMPEVHPAVSGFEMMLRYIFPLYDVFALYGRPTRLIADTLDTRSLMFALPQERRYGYLEILDVAGLVHEKGSQAWSEREWRKKLKDITSTRMTRIATNGRPRSRASSYRDYRNSLPSRAGTLRYEDGASIKSTPSLQDEKPPVPPPHTSSAPPDASVFQPPSTTPSRPGTQHQRSFSEAYPTSELRYRRSEREHGDQSYTPSRLSYEQKRPSYDASRSGRPLYEQAPPPPPKSYEQPPMPPTHSVPISVAAQKAQMQQRFAAELDHANERSSSESERRHGGQESTDNAAFNQDMRPVAPPAQVAAPPAFSHEPGAKPQKRPGVSPDLRRANSRLSITTLQQLADAGKNSAVGGGGGGGAAAAAGAAWRSNSGSLKSGRASEDRGQRGVIDYTASKNGNTADHSTSAEGMVPVTAGISNPNVVGSRNVSNSSSQFDSLSPPYYRDRPLMSSYDLLTPQNSISRNASPLSKSTTPSPPLVSTQSQTDSYQKPANDSKPSTNSSAPIQKTLPDSIISERPSPARSNTSHSISRKPVPKRNPTSASQSHSITKQDQPFCRPLSPGPPILAKQPSIDSLNDRYIDEDALAQVLGYSHTHSMTSEAQRPFPEDDASIYENDSNVSPDYASTRRSTETKRSQRSLEKPRRGALKTVGTIEPDVPKEVQVGDSHYRSGATPEPQISAAIPIVDFGPTKKFDPGVGNQESADESPIQPEYEHRDENPATNPQSSTVYASGQAVNPFERAPSRNARTPEPQPSGSLPAEENRKSIAWQPGAQIGGGSPGSRLSLTAEQFVQQRAAANRVTPVYAHGRQNSASPTPPNASRQTSSEWAAQQPRNTPNKLQKRQSSYGNEASSRPQSRAATNLVNFSAESPIALSVRENNQPNKLQKRQSSYGNDMPSRPQSRGPSNIMAAPGDYTSHLSAREQEHIARVTGSPLVTMASNPNKDIGAQSTGLVGAIEAREKEKKGIKEGLNNHMVQQAIAQRQHHSHQQRQSSYTLPVQQYTTPQPQYAMPGGFPPSPNQYPSFPTTQQQYGWSSPQEGQQQYQQYQQYQQQPRYPQQQQWTPPSAGQFVGPQQPSLYQQQSQQHYQDNSYNNRHQHQQQQGQYYNGQYHGN